MTDDPGRTHYFGDDCPGGHYDPTAGTCPECAEVTHDRDCRLVGDGRPVEGDPLPDRAWPEVLRVEAHDIRPDDRLALILEDDLDADLAGDLADALAGWAGLDPSRVVVISRAELARIRPVEEPEP